MLRCLPPAGNRVAAVVDDEYPNLISSLHYCSYPEKLIFTAVRSQLFLVGLLRCSQRGAGSG